MTWLDGRPRRAQRKPGLPSERFRADTLAAAIVVDRSGMEGRWSEHPQGEDVGWALDAERRGIPRWVDPTVRCAHLMVPDRSRQLPPEGSTYRVDPPSALDAPTGSRRSEVDQEVGAGRGGVWEDPQVPAPTPVAP